MYVYGLVAPHTVNTMPLPTLQAAAAGGEVTGATAAEDPEPDLRALAEAGIDLDDVTDKLLRDGIAAFVVPMNKLLAGIESKREMIVTGRPASFEADLPPDLEQPVAERLKAAREQDVAHRLWRRDGTLWAPAGTPELEDRLGWLTIAEKVLEELPDIKAFAAELRDEGYTDVVLLGMGGSSLAPEVFRRSSPPSEGALRLHVLDSTEPLQVKAVHDAVDPEKTLFIVSSKSGGTIEPNALLAYFRGVQPDPRHFVAITDPGTSMAQLAEREGFRRTFLSDPEIGGRHSPLAAVGVVAPPPARRGAPAGARRGHRGGGGAPPGGGGNLAAPGGPPGAGARARGGGGGRGGPEKGGPPPPPRRSRRSGCGPSSSSPSPPASGSGASSRSPTSP